MALAGDVETTGLLKPELTELHLQPHIIEISLCKFDSDFKIIDEFWSFVKPPVPVSEEITKITGITNDDLRGAPAFVEIYDALCDFVFGQKTLFAHNCTFDVGMLAVELRRIDKLLNFPWPKNHMCTVELSYPIQNKRMKLNDLHKLATGRDIVDAHRASSDTRALVECIAWLDEKGFL